MFSTVPSLPSPNKHLFSKVPHADIPRSSFNRSHTRKSTIPGDGYLIPIYVDEALPGDTFKLNFSTLIRFNTLLNPVMDNMYADVFFFACPNRLLWDHWVDFMGEHRDGKGYQDTDYLVPVVTTPAGGHLEETLYDYMGIPIGANDMDPNALHFRMYNLVYEEWFRDQNLIDPTPIQTGDGPDADTLYTLKKRGKRHDYFTSALPWPQKGVAVDLPLGSTAPVITASNHTWNATDFGTAMRMWKTADGSWTSSDGVLGMDATDGGLSGFGAGTDGGTEFSPANLYADLSNATAATINSLREAFQLQKMMEREALGGTRYTEIIKSHFGVTSPDHRLQRPEYLGGGSIPFRVEAVPGTNQASSLTFADLGAQCYTVDSSVGFTQSFTEHCCILGLINIRCDITYQQGLNRLWSRQTKHDYYWPLLAHLGEQEVLNKEIWASGTSATDNATFGYQERWAEYRYYPSLVTGAMRSDHSVPLDNWHLALDFSATPNLNQTFIEEDPPFDRITIVNGEAAIRMDAFFDIQCVRPMPLYSVPGLIDHF